VKNLLISLLALGSISSYAADELKCNYTIKHSVLNPFNSLKEELNENGYFNISSETWPHYNLELKGKHTGKAYRFEYSNDESLATIELMDGDANIIALSQAKVDFGQEYKLKGAKIYVKFISRESYIDVDCK